MKHPLPDKPIVEPPLKKQRPSSSGADKGTSEYENKEQKLHDEIVAFVKWLEPTDQEIVARELVFGCIERIIHKRFGRCEVELFGSVPQGLCFPDSDLDIVVLSKQFTKGQKLTKTLRSLRTALLRRGISRGVEVIAKARVPIVKMLTTPAYGNFHVDISFNSKNGVDVVHLVKMYMNSMPALRPLLLVLKRFLDQRGFNNTATSGIGSFILTNMVISFLQLNPGQRPPELLDNPLGQEALGRILLDFFYYYGYTFPYETHYICVVERKLGLKKDKGWDRGDFRAALAIESMIDSERDIGAPVGKIKLIRKEFQLAFETLKDLPFDTTARSVDVLSSIVKLAKGTIGQRRRLEKLVNSGALARATASADDSSSDEPRRKKGKKAKKDRSESPPVSREYHTYSRRPHPYASSGFESRYHAPLPPPPPAHPGCDGYAYNRYADYPPPYYGRDTSPPSTSYRDYPDYDVQRRYEYEEPRSHTVSRDDYQRYRQQRR
ncbi:Nucleotidyltransferase [Heliocybe sulcata]|uniref:polynucleotide adenylyltransferase n=1 Tax=Heliocybe sulcata TaxID=5364 RepID=A0A5C3NHR1_9AGAM|nr:Nucleotidyltransferase [Heliocybe sulcata]